MERRRFRTIMTGACGALAACLILGVPGVASGEPNPVADWQNGQIQRKAAENRGRVTQDIRAAGLAGNPQVVFYAVDALSDIMRTPDVYPTDGRFQGELRVIAAQDEFEPASFQLFAFQDARDVRISAGQLRTRDGKTLPADAVDLKVVKVWYQNGNGWQSYFQDTGLKLTPELLLYDENLVRVDTREKANYARLREGGREEYVWISSPASLDPKTFNPYTAQFADADRLQPVTLTAGQFKQFYATVRVPKGQAAGIYRGAISVAIPGMPALQIPLVVRVLPFELPQPGTYYDPERLFLVSFMGGASLDRLISDCDGDRTLALQIFRKKLANFRNHNLMFPCVDQNPENFALLREFGFPTQPIMMGKNFMPWFGLNFGGRMTYDNMKSAEYAAKKCAEYYRQHFGHTDVLTSYGDEQGTAFVAAHRNFFRYFHEYGIRMGCAGHDALLNKGGYTYDIHPYGGEPDSPDRIRPWHEIGDKYIGFYASQHTGAENPQYIRRQHGLLSYLNNHNMAFNYEYALGPWNDRTTILYKPMVVAYENHGGLVDTLQWEGFREGIDDIRYATQLKILCDRAIASGDVARKLEAKKALQFLALLRADEMDLNYVRTEIMNHILNLL